ncbi:hypothetical protein A2619_04405 [candidate division WWE3 bacterium RIFOXYD1_FULL_39_9]|uniref:Uncharacterized protein n=1 Tax=candidate division WWE3 bacterium RIFOXYD1_FULL_39_9 TaxID=1802649 RepID=A0A1F4X6E5_UNCKA|nr:MAG: hypothetical protein A2619_04405 [candidate division WWE3 bacterium RIFOXYD1_FULL_39_9]
MVINPLPTNIRIKTNNNLLEVIQTKHPKKKSNARWIKKYRKKYTKQVPSSEFYYFVSANLVVCHPDMVDVFIDKLNKHEAIKLKRI